MKTKLFVVYGGRSVEHEISLKTARTVLSAVDESKFELYPIYIARDGRWCAPDAQDISGTDARRLIAEPRHEDAAASIGDVLLHQLSLPGKKVVLPLIHGSYGEDGTLQGLLEMLNVPYVGNGVLSAALALDKAMSKEVLAQAGIRQVEHRVVRREQWLADEPGCLGTLEDEIGYPCYVKPASLGSSIGISRCEDRSGLLSGIADALQYDAKLVVERELPGREIQVAVMGNEAPVASLPGEFIHDNRFFDFASKYSDPRLRMSIPAEIGEDLTVKIRALALRAYRALGCEGLARVDFFLDRDGLLYLNEINALPGFTSASMYPVMWERTDGTTYAALIEKLIGYAFDRHAAKQSIRYERQATC
ncbi:D-alanine--D-alanine ligase family protein [Cohnella sp. JJ-181]|uniref:D-alanine--D-alanine ligase family protein n=1 Tax=Cohnella rhizoplanae TaxID=2974897 RepID=UPI0022FF9B95|nr:D-alanine--D-alanine ligase family protein [Cohnella sp. JJ-181]CAI6083486.1 D-alanine--D-alanine ligase [Cohnella sp. JJ-181]